MKELFKGIILENQKFIDSISLINRDISIDLSMNYIFTGARRSGKTYCLYQCARDLIKKKLVSIENIVYLNFEDERLVGLRKEDLDLIIQAYSELFDLQPIFFFDEIQNVPSWSSFVRRLADKKLRIYITGSNAHLLSNEFSSVLGGRFLSKEIFTLSFKEFLDFNQIKISKRSGFGTEKNRITALSDSYLTYGGFPEIVNASNKREYLSSIYQKVFFSDIVARYSVVNEQCLKLLVKKIAESINDETSYNRFTNIIKSVGIKVGTNTIIEYIAHLESSYLVSTLSNFTSKFVEREIRKKIYFGDTGLIYLFLQVDNSKALENAVFLQLKRNNYEELYYFKRNTETDFYVPETKTLIQVSWNVSNFDTKKREIKAFKKAKCEIDINNCTIITYDQEEEIIEEGELIRIVPFWKFALNM